jgi:hypothetical protein
MSIAHYPKYPTLSSIPDILGIALVAKFVFDVLPIYYAVPVYHLIEG